LQFFKVLGDIANWVVIGSSKCSFPHKLFPSNEAMEDIGSANLLKLEQQYRILHKKFWVHSINFFHNLCSHSLAS
jgi:abortive infection bacteriophage resistance protein